MFRFPFTVLFGQVDAVGITFFSRAFETCHAAFEAMLEAGGLPLAEILSARDWAAPLVHAEADFKRPMRMGEELDIRVVVGRMGKTSVTFDFTVVGAIDGEVRATAQHVHACIDMAGFTQLEVPTRLRDALQSLGNEAA